MVIFFNYSTAVLLRYVCVYGVVLFLTLMLASIDRVLLNH